MSSELTVEELRAQRLTAIEARMSHLRTIIQSQRRAVKTTNLQVNDDVEMTDISKIDQGPGNIDQDQISDIPDVDMADVFSLDQINGLLDIEMTDAPVSDESHISPLGSTTSESTTSETATSETTTFDDIKDLLPTSFPMA
ncbi:hypothetical protein FPSE_07051 [Fusarium pseudograminearum CS3096]|uniref:Uncharacterized protein n=1 Tax=Fusarium pseudograminearum (strain CS3096) TaxID=1028729 RepID=K3VZQ0_FUSPC|nr:hypothetical protein FPSE_07051 [Fusarium pseudograminearum CS3096]EKJ72785.1 hypothetical protein FPSE_07051 [Fusarium pseudograminearum CS3096]KAF0635137.1 hypothetical protein FPSE5266_07051 [Fusarium pseudograminearum]